MIEVLPFWKDPEFDPEKRKLIESKIVAEFPLLLGFPHYVGSHDLYHSYWHFSTESYTYTFSDGSREEFELQSPDLRPAGDLILEAVATENGFKRFLNVKKIGEELFLVSYASVDYSWLESPHEDSEIDGDFEFNGEDGEDWAETAPEDSLLYYEN